MGAAARIKDVREVRDGKGVYRLSYLGENIAPPVFDAGFGVPTIPVSVERYITRDARERGYRVMHLIAFSTCEVSARVEVLDG